MEERLFLAVQKANIFQVLYNISSAAAQFKKMQNKIEKVYYISLGPCLKDFIRNM